MEFSHVSVMLFECISALDIKPDGVYVDCTMGGGGHSEEIAKRLNDSGRLIAIDQDEDAVKYASDRLRKYGSRVTVVRDNFKNIKRIIFHRKNTIDDMKSCISRNNNLEYEAFILNEM